MAVVVTDQRGILNEADAVTGWTGSTTPTLGTSPTPVEASGQLGMAVGTATDDAYVAITSDDWSAGGTYSIWLQANGTMDTLVNGGVQVVVGDGTNRIGYHVGGSDQSGFRHEVGPVAWVCYLLDVANKPANFTAYAGTEASLDETAITQVGLAFKTLSKALGSTENCFWDILRFADPGEGITVTAGTVGVPGTLLDVSVADRDIANQKAFGILRLLATGVYGCQGNMIIGDTGATDSYFAEDGVTLAFEDRGLSTTSNYYRLTIVGGTGVHSFVFTNSTIVVPPAASGLLDASDTAIDTFDVSGSTIDGFTEGVLTGGSLQDWMGVTFVNNGPITVAGADIRNSDVSGYEGTADTSALIYNETANPVGEFDGSTFTKGTAATHAIEFGLSSPIAITLTDVTFSGYGADTTTSAAVHIKRTTGTVTISWSGGTAPTYKTDGATVVVQNTVTITLQGVVSGSQCSVHATAGGPEAVGTELMNEASAGSDVTEPYAFSTDQPIIVRVRKNSAATLYKPFDTSGTITADGYTLLVNQIEDNISP